MASLQDIRRRIKSVKNTQQITKAMKMVAAARLRRAQEAAISNQPYAEKMYKVIADVASNAGSFSHPLLEARAEGKSLFIVISADKGLAGAYSSNVCKEAVSSIEHKEQSTVLPVGRKALEYFRSRGYQLEEDFTGFSERPKYKNGEDIANKIIALFTSGQYKEVHLVYTKFVSAISAVPKRVQLLPFVAPTVEGANTVQEDFLYEPSPEDVLSYLLPQYIVTMIYGALLQAAASELSSRMNAMSNATDNAEELISKLDLHYNKVRQAGITREITEIVGGAEALK